jgi:hypothetical protein
VDLLHGLENGGHLQGRPHCSLLPFGDRSSECINPQGRSDPSSGHWDDTDRVGNLAGQMKASSHDGGGKYEETKKNESFEGSLEEKKR